MAKVEGFFKLRGSLGNNVYYKRGGNYFVRKKPGVSKENLDPPIKVLPTSTNMAEYGRACKGAQLIHYALSEILDSPLDPKATGRLTDLLVKLMRTGQLGDSANRKISDGNLALLNGFSFKKREKLFLINCMHFIDRRAGQLAVRIMNLRRSQFGKIPAEATHAIITAIALELDFENMRYKIHECASDPLALTETDGVSVALHTSATPGTKMPLVLFMHIEFIQAQEKAGFRIPDPSIYELRIIAAETVHKIKRVRKPVREIM